jgi:flavorubredoxin
VFIVEKKPDICLKEPAYVKTTVLRIQYQPTEKDLEECKRLGKDIANKVKKA